MSDGVGGATVAELERNMSSYELVEWMKEYALRSDEQRKAQKRTRGGKQKGEGSWRVT